MRAMTDFELLPPLSRSVSPPERSELLKYLDPFTSAHPSRISNYRQ